MCEVVARVWKRDGGSVSALKRGEGRLDALRTLGVATLKMSPHLF